MRWSIIRLIWLRELRDQLRDRRTLFMVAVLPVLIYPLLGLVVLQFALGFLKRQNTVAVYGADNLPAQTATSAGLDPLPAAAWLSLAPAGPTDAGPGRVLGAVALARLARAGLGQDFPPLLQMDDDTGRFCSVYFDVPEEAETLRVQALPWPEGVPPAPAPGEDPDAWLGRVGRAPLNSRQADLLLIVPAGFRAELDRGGRPDLYVLSREGDERSRLVGNRVHAVLTRWQDRIKGVRLLRHGLPADFDEPLAVRDPERARPPMKQAAENLFDALARIFPFLLVMWSLTGALYPAVDLCAGEKERGTMETLLISPASREEIVYGKFLTIWVFSGATALLNLASMGVTTALFSGSLPGSGLRLAAILWCVLLVLPLSAFFSALCLAVGAYARSTKEGQYYLMPLFLFTLPLIFLTLAPGVELNPLYSMVPVTGVALLLQRLLTAPALDQVPWGYFVPVLAPTALYGWLALRWAVSQFQREEVLFREAERLDLGLWLRRLLREKEALPSTGQALFCFALILALRWLSLGLGGRVPLLWHAAIDLVAFVIAPPLIMAMILTTQPGLSLGLRLPPRGAWLSAGVLGLLLVLPLADLTRYLLEQFPGVAKLLTETTPLAELLQAVERGDVAAGAWWQLPLVLMLLAPVCEELAFRGFILTGLRRRLHPWTAILLSSLLFAASHLNVFQLLPLFILGIVLGLVATRGRSVLPGMLLHLLYNGLVVAPLVFPRWAATLGDAVGALPYLRPAVAGLCALLAAVYLAVNGYRLWRTGRSAWWDEIPEPGPKSPAPGANGEVEPKVPAGPLAGSREEEA
jgi:sodium transport system permease protein